MNLKSPEPLVNFTNIQWNEISSEPKFVQWVDLWKIYNTNNYKIISEEELIQEYQNFEDWETFLLIQLKFFLIRNSFTDENKLPEKLLFWSGQLPGFCSVNYNLLSLILQFPQFRFQREIGMFNYYSTDFLKYIKAWTELTVDLKSWKRFRFVEVPQVIVEVASQFESTSDFTFPYDLMRKLFDQEVLLIYERVFKPRLNDKQLSRSEKSLIERVIELVGTKLDLDYLNRNFIQTSNNTRIPDNFIRCKNGKLKLEELDIHSPDTLKMYFALLKYHNSLHKKKDSIPGSKPTLWFKNISKKAEEKNEVFEILADVYDIIKSNCPNSNWSDFKSIFNNKGSSSKIEWSGDAEILNFLFRKLHKVLVFKGGKWKVIEFYFYRSDKNDRTLLAENLISNSHYSDSDNPRLSKRLNDLNSILSK